MIVRVLHPLFRSLPVSGMWPGVEFSIHCVNGAMADSVGRNLASHRVSHDQPCFLSQLVPSKRTEHQVSFTPSTPMASRGDLKLEQALSSHCGRRFKNWGFRGAAGDGSGLHLSPRCSHRVGFDGWSTDCLRNCSLSWFFLGS